MFNILKLIMVYPRWILLFLNQYTTMWGSGYFWSLLSSFRNFHDGGLLLCCMNRLISILGVKCFKLCWRLKIKRAYDYFYFESYFTRNLVMFSADCIFYIALVGSKKRICGCTESFTKKSSLRSVFIWLSIF